MIIGDREAFDRHWQGKRLMMGQGPWLMAYNRALVQFNAEKIREGASRGGPVGEGDCEGVEGWLPPCCPSCLTGAFGV
jgi:hypothetical protein